MLQAEGSGNCLGFASRDNSGVLTPYRFDRRPGRRTCVSLPCAPMPVRAT